ncbi:MAG: hypothetical protein WD342_14015 [Verrucomicrobiales bacterium]
MSFSFQTVSIAFAVTLAHLAIMAALSPTGGDVSGSYSTVEAELPEEAIEVELPEEDVEVAEEVPTVAELAFEEGGDVVADPERLPEQLPSPPGADDDEPAVFAVDLYADRPAMPRGDDLAEASDDSDADEGDRDSSVGSADSEAESERAHEIRRIEPKPRS